MSSIIFYLFLLIKNPATGSNIIKPNLRLVPYRADSTIILKEIESLKKLAVHKISSKEALVEELSLTESSKNYVLFLRRKSGNEIYIHFKKLDSTQAPKDINHADKYIIDSIMYKHVKLENNIPMICYKPGIIDYNPDSVSTLPIQVFCSKDVVRIYICIYKNKLKGDMKILLLKHGLLDSCIN